MAARHDHDGGHRIGPALAQMRGHLADQRLHALRQRRRAHELGAVVQQRHAPAQRGRQPRQRLRHIARASHQQPRLRAQRLDEDLQRRAATADALAALRIEVIRQHRRLAGLQRRQRVVADAARRSWRRPACRDRAVRVDEEPRAGTTRGRAVSAHHRHQRDRLTMRQRRSVSHQT